MSSGIRYAPQEFARRRHEWQATLNPATLWDGVSAAAFHAASAEIARVTAAVLSEASQPVPLGCDDPITPRELGVAAFVAGMGPLLGLWIERGQIDARQPLADTLARHLEHGRRRSQRIAEEIGTVMDALATGGVAVTVLKGLHTGQVYFPEPGTRPMGDVDILVAPNELDGARSALRAAGWVEVSSSSRPFRSEWATRRDRKQVHSVELDHADNPWTIDLHITLERHFFRGLTVSFGDESHRQRQPFAVAGRPAHGLAQPLLTGFLALHASYRLYQLQLVRLVETVLVIRRDQASGALTWDELAGLLERTGTQRFVYPALVLTDALVPGTIDSDLLRRLSRSATLRTRRVIFEMTRGGTFRLSRRSLEDKLMWARGPWQLVRNFLELLWPSDDIYSARSALAFQRRYLWKFLSGKVGVRSRGA